MSTRGKIIISSLSIVVAFVLIGGALALTHKKSSPAIQKNDPNHVISKAELLAADGKNGHRCFVAVDGVVYEIKDSPLWQNGQHTTSGGLAYCGADLSEAIKQSPHGKSKLAQLPIVGKYPRS